MLKIQENISLKNYSTFKIGGKARYFATVKNVEEITEALDFSFEKEIPFFILGNGSNILFSDEEYEGLVIKVQSSKFKVQSCADSIEHPRQSRDNSRFKVVCGSGLSLAKLVSETAKNNLTGFEWAAGIPGTVGGAIYGNAGAFSSSMADVVEKVGILDIQDCKILNPKLQIKIFKKKDCQFDYRESVFKRKKNLIIIEIEFKLKKGNKKKIKEKIKRNLLFRKTRQPLDLPSAGSIFKNVKFANLHKFTTNITNQKIREICGKFENIREIPAAYLIEKCGLKGKKIGGAKISEKHANFIVNLGKAKARDVKKLIDFAKKKVREKFGLKLEEEIVIF